MAHFAKIDVTTNVVLEVNVVNNADIDDLGFPESEPVGIAYLQPWSTPDTYWKQTSFNKSFRKHYAGVGYNYSFELDAFIPPQPYPSWSLDETTCLWTPPVPYPNDPNPFNLYDWDESNLSWVKVQR
jgi:hypothetical protein